MMTVVRAVGKELTSAVPSELTVGNLVRRVLFMIREEYAAKVRQVSLMPSAVSTTGTTASSCSSSSSSSSSSKGGLKERTSGSRARSTSSDDGVFPVSLATLSLEKKGRSYSMGSDEGVSVGPVFSLPVSDSAPETELPTTVGSELATPLEAPSIHIAAQPYGATAALPLPLSPTSKRTADFLDSVPSLENVLGQADSSEATNDEFSQFFPDLRSAVMAAVNELNDELDNVYQPICEQAQEHIGADECILTYGHSVVVEMFLRAAARKRRYQVIVSEAAPGLDGHKLATNLSKISNIAVTLIPDSNIYAIMSRVNKVIFTPMSVMADGGAICSSGHLMVTTAAKEYSVPVVGLTSAFMLTPLFAHNQSSVLNQLVSPVGVIPYHTPVNFEQQVGVFTYLHIHVHTCFSLYSFLPTPIHPQSLSNSLFSPSSLFLLSLSHTHLTHHHYRWR